LKEAPTKIAMSRFVTLRCNVCKITLICFNDYDKFQITKNACQFCADAQVKLNYAPKESPLPMQANQHIGCIYCDKVVRSLIEFPSNIEKDQTEQTSNESASNVTNAIKPVSKADEVSTPIIIVSKKKNKKGRR
jgi:hypothetical protein